MYTIDFNRSYIVFGPDNYNSLGIIRSLGEEGIRPYSILVRQKTVCASKSKYSSALYMVSSPEEGLQLLIKEFGNSPKKPIIFTAGDPETEILDRNYDILSSAFIFFNAGKAGGILEYMEKKNITALAAKYGLNTLPTIEVEKGFIPDQIEYPIMTKSVASVDGGKTNVFICYSQNDLIRAYDKIHSSKVILQKYIVKKNELSLDGISCNRGTEVAFTIAATYEYVVPETYSHYMTVTNCIYEKEQQAISSMIKEIGFEGIFNIEFLVDQDDTLYFLEINLRNATWSYASTVAGMNMPILWSQAMLEGKMPKDVTQPISPSFKAMVEVNDFRTRVRRQKMNPFRWFREMAGCKCLFYCNKKDPLPIFAYYLLRRNLIKKRP